jgi:hypothetical protein
MIITSIMEVLGAIDSLTNSAILIQNNQKLVSA